MVDMGIVLAAYPFCNVVLGTRAFAVDLFILWADIIFALPRQSHGGGARHTSTPKRTERTGPIGQVLFSRAPRRAETSFE